MFQYTTAIKKIRKLDKFVKGIQGGTSAGKTYGIIPILIDIAAKTPHSEISIVAESIPHLKRGAMKDFKKIMVETGRWVESRWNATDFKYTFANKSQIEFFSADADAKLRGARRDWLYMNECNNMTFHAYNELASRTKNGVYLDWNPTNEFWFHEHLINDNDVDFLIINYLDNESCPESALNFILKAKEKAKTSDYWLNWYKVYGLGEIGSLQGTVFEFSICKQIPTNAKLLAYGLDWGYSSDPTAFVEVWQMDKELYINELIYETKLTNSMIVERFNKLKVSKYVQIVADSSEPKSIQDISNFGYSNIIGAKKGADSIVNSIDTLQQFKIHITEQSTNVIKEFRQYRWGTDKDGKQTNIPQDANNHSIDAIRYVALNKINKASGNYSFHFC